MVTGLWSALKPYPRMKASGVEWLGAVPEHWEIERGKNLFTKVERPVRDSDEVITCFRDGTVTLRKNRRTLGFTESLKEIGYQSIRKGDLVIHSMDAFAGAVGVADSDGKGTPVYSVCNPKPNTNSYYHALLIREMARNQWILALAKGIRERSTDFRFSTYAVLRIPHPPLAEQNAIVKYLDYSQRRIRKLIQAKRKLIGLLNEQKQAIIHQAVTRGLDPDVPLKDSGIEWLGQIPKHWEVVRFKRLALVLGNLVDPRLESQKNKVLIAPNHIEKDGTSRVLRFETANEQGADSGKYEVKTGYIIYCKIRPYLRKAIIAPFNCLCSADMYPIAVRNPTKITYEFLLLQILSLPFTQYTIDCSLRAAMPKINREALGEAPLWSPSLKEQAEIIEYLNQATAEIDQAIDRANREIELLNEYRARLIADVVTGKLDVREIAAALPETDPLANEDLTDPLEEENDLESTDETEED